MLKSKIAILALAAAMLVAPAAAQSIGGNASISVTTGGENVQLPGSTATYPFVSLEYVAGATLQEVFFALGTSNSAAATTSSPAIPAAGLCLPVGPNKYVAAITGTSTATLRVTQWTSCPQH